MDPKSLVGKPPELETLKPDFAARLSAWIATDMRRARDARAARDRAVKPGREDEAEELRR